MFGNCTDPTFLMNITPTRKRQYGPSLAVSLCREKKKLHAFFSHPNLRDPLRLIVVKNAAADCAKIGELLWNVVVFKPVFHKEQITQCPRFSAHRIEGDRSSGAGHRQ